MEFEQQALFGAPGVTGLAVASSGCPTGPAGPAAGPAGPAPESLSQMPFFSSELPQDFLQTCPVSKPPQQNQNQTGPQHAGSHQGYPEGAPNPGALLASGLRPRSTAEHSMSQLESRSAQRFLGTAGLPDPGQPTAMALPQEAQAYRFGHDLSSSSPSSPVPCLSGEPSTLKRSKRDTDDAGAGTPLSSHSDDVTASSAPAALEPAVASPQVKVRSRSQPNAQT